MVPVNAEGHGWMVRAAVGGKKYYIKGGLTNGTRS